MRTKAQPVIGTLAPPTAVLTDEDSLMNEAAQLQDGTVGIDDASLSDEDIAEPTQVAVGQIVENELSEDSDDDDDDDMDDSEKALSAYKKLCIELDVNQYAYDKYIQLCDLAQ